MMSEPSRTYFSYLLRMWRTGQGQEATWQASMESPLTGERHEFSQLDKLWAFLLAQMQIDDETKKTYQIKETNSEHPTTS
jgi:hypothetical protein